MLRHLCTAPLPILVSTEHHGNKKLRRMYTSLWILDAMLPPRSARFPFAETSFRSRYSAPKAQQIMPPKRAIPFLETVKYVGYCCVALGGIAFLRARIKASIAARARLAPTIKMGVRCLECGPQQVSIFSLNALSPSLVSKQRYKYCPWTYMEWKHRLPRLCAILDAVRPCIRLTKTLCSVRRQTASLNCLARCTDI